MSDAAKTLLTALVGIVLGVIVTYLGVEKINKVVIEKAVALGENAGSLSRDLELRRAELDDLGASLAGTVAEITTIESEAESILAAVKVQRRQLQDVGDDITKLLQSVANLNEDDAVERLAIVQQLITDLNGQSGTGVCQDGWPVNL